MHPSAFCNSFRIAGVRLGATLTVQSLHLCRSCGMGRCREASAALDASSFSFFTVSLPIWFSLEMGSSREGISCFFRFFVRFVTTCMHPDSFTPVVRAQLSCMNASAGYDLQFL